GGVILGDFNKNDSLKQFMDALNQAGGGAMKDWFSFDEATGKYTLESKNGRDYETKYKNTIVFSALNQSAKVTLDTIAERAADEQMTKGVEKTMGQDALVHATVNGKDLSLRRSSNLVEMDGLSVTLKEEFDARGEDGKVKASDAVTFKTGSNSDVIVEAVRSFVEDVNKLMTGVHDAFATQPLKKSSTGVSTKRDGYEPLTESDKADMSEEAVKNYEEKAKTGLLFGDTDLRTLYDKLLGSIQSFGGDRVDLESIGLTTTYSGGVTTFSLNETKLRAALESDPDKVRTVFTKTTETSESGTNGLMQSLKQTLNAYGSTSLGSPGILVRKAGTKLSAVSLLNNNLQSQIDIISKQIESWQSKLGDRVDYYTKQFTQLEKLMSTMNNQSSMLADMMGY
ncbi:MAG: flagellar filament capping protein FliD, partial [Oscillospiraceae bacterium]|nr:flagellar filament capping protein FliD [Oscillospiraceae bacterium]